MRVRRRFSTTPFAPSTLFQAEPALRPAALATLAADPLAGCDIFDSEAYPDFVAAVPAVVLGSGQAVADGAAVIAAVAAAAQADAPARLCALAGGVLRGMAGGHGYGGGEAGESVQGGTSRDPNAIDAGLLPLADDLVAALALALLRDLASSWACFREPLLQEAAAVAAAAVALDDDHGPALDPPTSCPRLIRLAGADPKAAWWGRWAETPKVARYLFAFLAASGDLGRHADVVSCLAADPGDGHWPRHAALTVTITASAVACATGRAALGEEGVRRSAEAVARVATILGGPDEQFKACVIDAAAAGLLLMAEAHCCGALAAFPPGAVHVLVHAMLARDRDGHAAAADRAAAVLAALCCTPAGVDAVLWAGDDLRDALLLLPPRVPPVVRALAAADPTPALSSLRAALESDWVGTLHLTPDTPCTPASLAAAVASRVCPCCVGALAAVGVRAPAAASAWLAGPGAGVSGSGVDKAVHAAAALGVLEARARAVAAVDAVDGRSGPIAHDIGFLDTAVRGVSVADVADAAAALLQAHGPALGRALVT